MRLTIDEYQYLTFRTMNNKVEGLKAGDAELLNYAVGMAGEVGEVLEVIKKSIFHGHEWDRDKLKTELGDLLWYITALATLSDISLEEIMESNINKLKDRYPNGFNSQDSINRVEAE